MRDLIAWTLVLAFALPNVIGMHVYALAPIIKPIYRKVQVWYLTRLIMKLDSA